MVARQWIVWLALVAAVQAGDRKTVVAGIKGRTGQSLPAEAKKAPGPFAWPPGMAASDTLTADEAVAAALWNNTALEADLAALGVAKADLLEAGLLRNPNLSSLLPVGGKPFEFLLNWPLEELWQRKHRVKAAEINVRAVAAGLEQNGLNLVRDVRQAHADLWMAEERMKTLREAAQTRRRIAEMTGKRRDAGDASGLEVVLAEADARSAEETAARAAAEVEIARTRLRGLMGMRNLPRPLSARGAATEAAAAPEEAALLEAAYQGRPDLRAAEIQVEAAAARARWQKSRVLTMLTAILSAKESGSPQKVRPGPGVQGELPVFQRNQGQKARADAEVEQAAWRYAALRDRVEQEVREARQRLVQARESREQLAARVRPVVEQALGQTGKAYRNGDSSLLNVLEAARQRYDVMVREVEAEASVRRAKAEVERATGKSI